MVKLVNEYYEGCILEVGQNESENEAHNSTKSMKGCEDFLTTVLCAHVICAANLSQGHDRYNDVTFLAKEQICKF